MFKHVLVPFDGSDVAMASLNAAFAAAGSGRVVLLHVIDPEDVSQSSFGAADTTDPMATVSTTPTSVATAEALIDAARSALVDRGQTLVESLILKGSPGEQIVRTAAGGDFDLIVMGTHGRTGLFRSVLGSVADYVLLHVRDIPVMLLHPTESEPQWAEGDSASGRL